MLTLEPRIKNQSRQNKGNDDEYLRSSWLLNKFSLSAPEGMYREQCEENAYWYQGVKG